LLGGRALERFSIEIDQSAELPSEHAFQRLQRFGEFFFLHERYSPTCQPNESRMRMARICGLILSSPAWTFSRSALTFSWSTPCASAASWRASTESVTWAASSLTTG